MNRRSFIGSILAAATAPAIVRADSLMRIVPRDTTVTLIRADYYYRNEYPIHNELFTGDIGIQEGRLVIWTGQCWHAIGESDERKYILKATQSR